jgi:UDP-glucose 4-epimerase
MKVIVTGGAGFIGSHIVDALLSKGHSPFVVDNFSSGSRKNIPDHVPAFEVDIRDGSKLGALFDEIRPDWVSHQAAQVSVSRSMRDPIVDAENNVMGSLNVFNHAARVGVSRIVFGSSGGVLYGDVSTPAGEDHPKRPISPYGISKLIGEQYLDFYARERGFCGVALRYSNVYGPRQNPSGEAGLVSIFCTAMLSGDVATINGDGRSIRDFVYGPDVALANVAALETTFNSHFVALNIGTGIGTDLNELAVQVRRAIEKYHNTTDESAQIPNCRHGESRNGDLRSNIISPQRAKELIGWIPSTSLDEGLRETVRWFGEKLRK